MMSKKYLVVVLAFLLIFSSFLYACAEPAPAPAPTPTPAPPTPAPTPVPTPQPPAIPIELSFAYTYTSGQAPATAFDPWFKEELEKMTNGRVKVLYFPDASAASASDSWNTVTDGTVDIGNITVRTEAKRLPLNEVTSLPSVCMANSYEGNMKGSETILELHKLYPEMAREFKDVKLLWFMPTSPKVLVGNKEVHVPADVKGMKIGAGGGMAAALKAAGASPTSVTRGEIYMSLKTGVEDAHTSSWSFSDIYKLYEVVDYVTDFVFGQAYHVFIMNKNKFESLPPDIQDSIMSLGPEFQKRTAEVQAEEEIVGKKVCIDAGMKVIELTPAEQDLWWDVFKVADAEWLETAKAAGCTNGPKILEAFQQAAKDSFK